MKNILDPPRPEFKPLAEQVAEQLRDAILTGRLAKGYHLVEMDIARRLDVGRTTVREALKILDQQGLVQSIPRRGTFVSRLTPEEAAEVCAVRALLESHAAGIAAKKIEEDHLKGLRYIVEEMSLAARAGSLTRMVDLDLKFHATICRLSGLDRLHEVWSLLDSQVGAVIVASLENHNMSLEQLIERHQNIIKALESGVSEEAAESIRNHYRLHQSSM